MGNFSWDHLQRVWANTEWSWILLWFGLSALIVALIVLMRTSWGQSQPLRKCAVLSLLAHLLLAAYATTVEIVTASGNRPNQDGVRAVFWDNEQQWADSVENNSGASNVRPWERFAGADSATSSQSGSPVDGAATAAALQPPELERPETPISLEETALKSASESAAETPAKQPVADSAPALPSPDAGPTPDGIAGVDRGSAEPRAAAPIDTGPVETDPINVTPTTQNSNSADTAIDSPSPDRVIAGVPSIADPFAAGPGDTGSASASSPSRVDPLVPVANADYVSPLKPVNQSTGTSAANELAANTGASSGSTSIANASGSGAISGTGSSSAAGTSNAAGSSSAAGSPLVPVVIGGANGSPPSLYKDRTAQDRAVIAHGRGGSPEAEAAVQAALKWLAENQSPDGRWDADKFGAGRELNVLGHDRQGAGAKADTGISGLAMLAFLGAGNTHMQGKYKDNVRNGLEFLLNEQATDGNLGGKSEMFAFMYSHGIATLALSEAYAMTGDTRLEKPVRSAIGYTIAAQHQATGSWRYRPGESGDTSQLGWQLMALKSAELAGIATPDATRNNMIRYLKATSSGTHGGLAGYRPGERVTRPMTAEALVCRQFLGMTRDNPAGKEAGDYLLNDLPNNQRVNLYYWYYGTLSLYQLQGEHWERWNKSLQSTLIGRQVKQGDSAGSWEPDCVWAGYGGRVYSTAMAALCLEVYYRYLPLYGDLPE